MSRTAWLLTLLLATPVWAKPHLTSDIHEPDLNKAWDMVFVSEGYTQDEEDEFLTDARDLARRLQTESAAKPMRTVYTFNYHFVFDASAHGVSWKPGGKAGKTRIRSRVDTDGVLVTDDALADALAVEVAPDVDSVVIVTRFLDADAYDPHTFGKLQEAVTDPEDVRANADMPTDGQRVRIPALDPEAFIHELGHALFGLGDEYGEYDGAIPDDARWEIAQTPNLTTDPTGSRWAHITDTVIEGGGYYDKGVYRPAKDCRMRASRSKPFCKVCTYTILHWGEHHTAATPVLTQADREGGKLQVAWRKPKWTPLYYSLEVHRPGDDDDAIWETYVEGHLRDYRIPLPSGLKGKLEVRLYATNALEEWSDGDTRIVGKVETIHGLTHAVGH